ncbi:MAG: bacterial Ig-like domain-containing protein [Clostridia bacterium]|nr:bacterial Ig-like domain-containing protein [Clostridia bacterium]
MFKRSGLKITALVAAVLMSLACFSVSAGAVTDQDMAQISVKASNTNPTIGEIITVKVSIDNYRTMSPRIAAMYLSVSFDPSCFEFVAGSERSLLSTYNAEDLTSVAYDGIDKISFAYTYANSKKQTLPATANEIFSFLLKVKNTVKEKTPAEFKVNDLVLYNGKSETKYSLIECKEPQIDNVTAWPSRPGILLNDSDRNEGTYNGNVTISFDAANGSLIYENRAAISVTSPYVCDKNGRYTITVTSNGEKLSQTFTIDKTISHLSVKPGTYNTEYPLGVSPDYSAWILLVTYKDGTYSELQMDDSDISITGFNASVIGKQTLLVKYKDKTTQVEVSVNSKNVISFSIKSPLSKLEYLIGDEIDTTGGVLSVVYDDGTSEEIPITKNMLSGYDNTYVGEQTVTVTYATATQSFKLSFISREEVDRLILEIEALDINTIDENSRGTIEDLITKYNRLTALQKSAVTNFNKLENARAIYNALIQNGTSEITEPADTTEPGEDTSGDGKHNTGNIFWYLVAGIIVLSVLGGIGYFLFIYFKRKKEIDEDDEYYDDGDFDDDSDDNVDLSYEEDIINIDDEDEDGGTVVNDDVGIGGFMSDDDADDKEYFDDESVRDEDVADGMTDNEDIGEEPEDLAEEGNEDENREDQL